jgi:nitrogen fixation/metabolism regulation signal transduction histidine kinase
MQEECRMNGIDFSLQLKGNIYQMTNNYVTKEELSILLADHIKDAIIAINHTDTINKTIMVRLGKIDDNFGLYIYDSGVEFPKEVLENLGKKPITTYHNEGGTGMGFMNTFDTLNKHNASLIIESIGKPSNDNYTKVIKIIFDGKNDRIYK